MKLRLLFASVVFVALSACQTSPFSTWSFGKSAAPEPQPVAADTFDSTATGAATTGGLIASPNRRFPDVPMPMDLREVPAETWVFESTQLAVGRLVYTSRAGVNELAQFYVDECKRDGWNMSNFVQGDVSDIMFTKPDKNLRVTVSNSGLARGRKLTLVLTPTAP